MGIGNIFKKQTKADSSTTGQEVRPSEGAKTERERGSGESSGTNPELKGNDFSYSQIVSPYLTEKTSILNTDDQYVFKVFKNANKVEIKKAIEKLYGVHVKKVRIIVVPSKERRLGRFEGEKAGFKKAMVRLRQGEKIEVAAH